MKERRGAFRVGTKFARGNLDFAESVVKILEYSARIGIFLGVLLIMMLWEMKRPRRSLRANRYLRWRGNLFLVAANNLLIQVCLPMGLAGLAQLTQENGWGLFNWLSAKPVVAGIFSFFLLDLAVYFQHILFHHVPILWKLHRVHHADLDIDVTTGVRFHPIEIVISSILKAVVIFLLGAPALSVILFEVVLNATAMFNHGNVMIDPRKDKFLRYLLVTPDMHRVHHSIILSETNSNFGFNFPWWDVLFGTYKSQPEAGHEGMTIGLPNAQCSRAVDLPIMLGMPFIKSSELCPKENRNQDRPPFRRNG